MAWCGVLHHTRCLPPICDHARHDHGYLPANGTFSGRVWELPDSTDAGRPRHGISLCKHGQLLGLPVRRAVVTRQFLYAGGANRFWLDPVSAAGDLARDARVGLGHYIDGYFFGIFCHWLHHGWPELCGHSPAGAYTRHDADAYAVDHLGNLHRHSAGVAGFPCAPGQRHHDESG